jgi:hypothetical protein
MSQEGKSRQPDVMPLSIHGCELESSFRSQDENRSVKDVCCTLWRTILILDVEDRLDDH